jgi:cellulose synthase/poly-beta-1,6-N-acetylglucosamine synthase-like glycosyltransferase
MILLLTVILLFICYSALITYYWQSWRSIPDYVCSGKSAQTKISVVIPARNEEENIGNLLRALQEQFYPKEFFEIIVVDDHSNDATATIVQQFSFVKLLQLKDDNINSYKKKAIEIGIAAATGELIVTTDADCLPTREWLKTIAAFKEVKHAIFIVGPVVFEDNNSFLEIFQSLDFLTLQGITGASVYKNIHSMCNGANLAYEKKVFYEVGGFSGVDHVASGDDMLLMHKIWKKYPQQVYYLKSKDIIVTTQPMKTWNNFFNQRIRWASKAKEYNDKRIFAVLLLVYLFNLSFLGLLVFGIWNLKFVMWFLALWIAKTVIEFPFVYSVAIFFNKQKLMKFFFFFQPLHIFYIIVSGFLGQIGKYEWKGRKVR